MNFDRELAVPVYRDRLTRFLDLANELGKPLMIVTAA